MGQSGVSTPWKLANLINPGSFSHRVAIKYLPAHPGPNRREMNRNNLGDPEESDGGGGDLCIRPRGPEELSPPSSNMADAA